MQPKSAASDKHNANGPKSASTSASARGRRTRRPRTSRPAKKTAEELDSEMADYFESANNATATENTNGAAAAPAATNGDAPMEDEIM